MILRYFSLILVSPKERISRAKIDSMDLWPKLLLAFQLFCFKLRLQEMKKVDVNEPPEWLSKVRATLDERFLEQVNLSEIALDVGLHPVYLTRTFRTYYGCNITEYLLRRRLDHALQLFSNDTLSLAEIAIQAGFCDQSHFSKQFKRFYGVSPGCYRRAYSSFILS